MNDPNRIEEMARRHLILGPTTSDQMITSVAGIPQRLQPVDPNNARGPALVAARRFRCRRGTRRPGRRTRTAGTRHRCPALTR